MLFSDYDIPDKLCHFPIAIFLTSCVIFPSLYSSQVVSFPDFFIPGSFVFSLIPQFFADNEPVLSWQVLLSRHYHSGSLEMAASVYSWHGLLFPSCFIPPVLWRYPQLLQPQQLLLFLLAISPSLHQFLGSENHCLFTTSDKVNVAQLLHPNELFVAVSPLPLFGGSHHCFNSSKFCHFAFKTAVPRPR